LHRECLRSLDRLRGELERGVRHVFQLIDPAPGRCWVDGWSRRRGVRVPARASCGCSAIRRCVTSRSSADYHPACRASRAGSLRSSKPRMSRIPRGAGLQQGACLRGVRSGSTVRVLEQRVMASLSRTFRTGQVRQLQAFSRRRTSSASASKPVRSWRRVQRSPVAMVSNVPNPLLQPRFRASPPRPPCVITRSGRVSAAIEQIPHGAPPGAAIARYRYRQGPS